MAGVTGASPTFRTIVTAGYTSSTPAGYTGCARSSGALTVSFPARAVADFWVANSRRRDLDKKRDVKQGRQFTVSNG